MLARADGVIEQGSLLLVVAPSSGLAMSALPPLPVDKETFGERVATAALDPDRKSKLTEFHTCRAREILANVNQITLDTPLQE